MAGRRANFTGCVRQRKDGSWEAIYIAGRDPATGKAVRKSIYGKTQRDVTKRLNVILAQVEETGEYIAPSNMTVAEWMDRWLADFCTKLKASSKAVYERTVRNYINPNIGGTRLKELKPDIIQRMFNTLSGKVSPHTVKDTRGILHKALEKAVRCQYIPSNPCNGIEIGKVEKPEISVLTTEHISKFLQACREDRYGDYLAILLYTGMRESELMGLPWKNVDFENGTLTVSQQLENRTYEITTTKTGKGRTFKPATVVMDILKRIKAQQDAYKAQVGKAWADTNDLVFTSEIGEHYCHNTVRKHLHRIAETIGLPDLRVHDLRHSYSVLAVLAGEDVKSIQETLGHSTIVTTMDIYSRFSKDLQQASSDRMSDFFSRF